MSDARRYAVWTDPRSRSRSRALESLNSVQSSVSFSNRILFKFVSFSKPISSAIYNGSWQVTTNS